MTEAQTFLAALWGHAPHGAGIQIWDKETKKTSTFPSGEPELAANYAVLRGKSTDVYTAAGLAARVDKPVRRRASAGDVIGIPGLWADIDVEGGPESKKNAAPSRDDALKLAHALLDPTIIVSSGYGIQAWWLLDEPWLFSYEPEREQAARLSAGFQYALKAAAREAGYDVDSTFDLARLMRLPGTMNHKGAEPVMVELLLDDGPRYELSSLSHVANKFMTDAQAAALKTLSGNAVDVQIELDVQPPFELLQELLEINTDFAAVWARKGKKVANWSASEYDLSIASYCVGAGFSDQEIANTLIYFRRRHGGADKIKSNPAYIPRTISKARAEREDEERESEEAEMREDSIRQLQRASRDPAAPPAVTISLFSRILGGPEVKELVQIGRDPDRARFVLVLADGEEVPLGSVSNLISQAELRKRFAVVTSHMIKMVKADKWHNIVQALLNAAVIREGEERDVRAIGWLHGYLAGGLSTDRDAAMTLGDPFEEEGYVHVQTEGLNTWLRRIKQERLSDTDVRLYLEAAGFERKTIAYLNQSTKKRTSRSYYRAPRAVIDGPVVDDPEEADDGATA